VQLHGALFGLPGLDEFCRRFLHVRRALDLRQLTLIGGTVLREGAGERRPLLIEVVLKLLAIELNQHLAARIRSPRSTAKRLTTPGHGERHSQQQSARQPRTRDSAPKHTDEVYRRANEVARYATNRYI